MHDPTHIDQRGKNINIPLPPRRIISLVPSQTELLADLGLEEHVVGITKFCIHPPAWRKTKALVGGTKHFDFEAIHSLQPDLIIGNKEENYKEGIEALEGRYRVWISDIVTLQDAFGMIAGVGQITGSSLAAGRLVDGIRNAFAQIKKHEQLSVLYLIWKKPWMAAGSGTFIHEMLATIGLNNVAGHLPRYPELTPQQIQELKPDLIFLSSEPYPFQDKHKAELQQLCPASKILLVDGEMFSWYGSRLLKAPAYFNSLTLP
jgi:ABC-type Fe3+-hydroxamate transport system substrate-binding protein